MKFASFRDENTRPRLGVVADEHIHVCPPELTLLDILGDPEIMRATGEAALNDPATIVEIATVQLLAPIATPPSVRDS